MSSRDPDVSVIIVNWNTRDLLIACLDAVGRASGTLHLEVIVVDNASRDDSVAMLRERYPEVHLIANSHNAGFARANNQALAVARGRYYLLLNTDAFLRTGAVETLVRHLDQHPRVGVAGCRLNNEDGTLQRSCSAFPSLATELWQALWLDRLFPRSPVFGRYLMTHWAMDDQRDVDCVLGAVMLLRREAIAQVGMFDEQFFMYSEEVDLCYRLKQAGWVVRFMPDASAVHLWGGSARQVPAQTFLRLYRSRVQFFRKHYGWAPTTVFRLLLFSSGLVRALGGAASLALRRDHDRWQSVQNYWALTMRVWGL